LFRIQLLPQTGKKEKKFLLNSLKQSEMVIFSLDGQHLLLLLPQMQARLEMITFQMVQVNSYMQFGKLNIPLKKLNPMAVNF
jgi:hypothetical protein